MFRWLSSPSSQFRRTDVATAEPPPPTHLPPPGQDQGLDARVGRELLALWPSPAEGAHWESFGPEVFRQRALAWYERGFLVVIATLPSDPRCATRVGCANALVDAMFTVATASAEEDTIIVLHVTHPGLGVVEVHLHSFDSPTVGRTPRAAPFAFNRDGLQSREQAHDRLSAMVRLHRGVLFCTPANTRYPTVTVRIGSYGDVPTLFNTRVDP